MRRPWMKDQAKTNSRIWRGVGRGDGSGGYWASRVKINSLTGAPGYALQCKLATHAGFASSCIDGASECGITRSKAAGGTPPAAFTPCGAGVLVVLLRADEVTGHGVNEGTRVLRSGYVASEDGFEGNVGAIDRKRGGEGKR